MRKVKIITIEGLGEVTVKEVNPLAAFKAMSAKNKVEELISLASDCITLPSGKELKTLYPSEIEQVVDAFLEVNSSFLSIAVKLSLKEVIVEMAGEALRFLPQTFASSYKVVMAKLPGIMDGLVSSKLLKS